MTPTLYFSIGKTFKKINKDKYPKLFGYLGAKSNEIISQFKNHCAEPNVYGFPEFALYENAMNSLIKETGVNERCVHIYMNGSTEEHKLCDIMGQGFYNDRIFKETDPSMHTIKEIEKEIRPKDTKPLYEQLPSEEVQSQILLTPKNWFKQNLKKDIDESLAKKSQK